MNKEDTELEQNEEFNCDYSRRNLYADGMIKFESVVGVDIRKSTIDDTRIKARRILDKFK